jgi:hypothetical protein
LVRPPSPSPSPPCLSSLLSSALFPPTERRKRARRPISARRTHHFVGYIVLLVHTGTVGEGADGCAFGAIVPVSPASQRANADGRVVVLMSRNATRHLCGCFRGWWSWRWAVGSLCAHLSLPLRMVWASECETGSGTERKRVLARDPRSPPRICGAEIWEWATEPGGQAERSKQRLRELYAPQFSLTRSQ